MTDKPEPPISNEELYIELKEVKHNQKIIIAEVFVAAAFVAAAVPISVQSLAVAVGLIALAGITIAYALGLYRRSWLTRIAALFEDDDIDETIEEAQERLTQSERVDGGDGE